MKRQDFTYTSDDGNFDMSAMSITPQYDPDECNLKLEATNQINPISGREYNQVNFNISNTLYEAFFAETKDPIQDKLHQMERNNPSSYNPRRGLSQNISDWFKTYSRARNYQKGKISIEKIISPKIEEKNKTFSIKEDYFEYIPEVDNFGYIPKVYREIT